MENVDNNECFTQHHLQTKKQQLWITEIVNNKSTEKKLSEQGLYTISHIHTYLLPLLSN